MKQNRILLCVVLFLMVFNILVPVLHAQQPLSGMSEEERNKKIKDAIEKKRKEIDEKRHPKVDHKLTELEDEYNKGAEEAAKKFNAGEVLKDDNGVAITKLEDAEKKGGGDTAKEFAKKRKIRLKENKVSVEITLEGGLTADTFDKKALEAYGGEDIGGWGRRLYADIPIDKIRKIADEVEGVAWMKALSSVLLIDSYRSEGLSKIGFSNYSAAGIRGTGVKIAVIDLGFEGVSNAISNSDLSENIIKVDCTDACHSEQGEESFVLLRATNHRKEVKQV
ncbi:MAG: hypothetical protein Q7T53_10615 [Deltaproteobacteria bacterium]|nr:hypothetical protein [Deltaproteobacteria bacterium]